jgi:hypothetical protein
VVTFEDQFKKSGETLATIMLRSDAHHDSVQGNIELEMQQLDEAKERGALIFDVGDMLDVMQTRFDPRREIGQIKSKHAKYNYLDLVVEQTAIDYAPYAENWVLMGRGNHETAMEKNMQTDLTERLVQHTRHLADGPTALASTGYSAYVKFRFSNHNNESAKVLYMWHGAGGGAYVTQNGINSHRMAQEHPTADLVWTGHVHFPGMNWRERWMFNRRSNKLGTEYQTHIVTPGYMMAGDGYRGFQAERLRNKPRVNGCCWVDFVWNRKTRAVDIRPHMDIHPVEVR